MVKLKISNQYTSADIKNKWEEITEKLNATPGVQKNWKGWRKVKAMFFTYLFKLLYS